MSLRERVTGESDMTEQSKAYERVMKTWRMENLLDMDKYHNDAEYHALIVRLATSAARQLVKETKQIADNARSDDIRRQRAGWRT
jgi:hypothetical protein